MNSVADWMKNSWVNDLLVLNNTWIWPALEALHFFGMCLLFGALIIMDLRLVGLEKGTAVVDIDKLAPIALAGFAINLFTGILFCFGDPHRYFINIAFHLKMMLILLAGLNFLYYKWKISPLVAHLGPNEDTPTIAKAIGAASLILWLGVLAFGRLIAYLGPQ